MEEPEPQARAIIIPFGGTDSQLPPGALVVEPEEVVALLEERRDVVGRAEVGGAVAEIWRRARRVVRAADVGREAERGAEQHVCESSHL